MLLKQTILYLPAQLLGPLFQFVSVVVWTHWLSPEHLGALVLIMATHELCHVMLGWFSYYTIRYIGQLTAAGSRDRFLATEASVVLRATGAAAIATLTLLVVVTKAPMSAPLLAATAAYVVTRSLSMHFADRARAEQRILAYTILNVSGPMIGLGIGIAFALLVQASVINVVLGYVLAQTAGLLVALPMIGFSWRAGSLDADILATAKTYGLPFVIGAPFLWAAGNGIRYIVDLLRGPDAVGLISVGWGLGQRGAAMVALLVSAAGLPLAIRRLQEEGEARGMEQLATNGILLCAVVAPAMGGLVMLAGPIAYTLVAEPYRAMTAAILVPSALAGALRNFRVHYTNQVYLLHERPRRAVDVDAIDAAASTALCIIGLILGGLAGAVWGAMIGAGVGLAFSVAIARREHGFKLPLGEIGRILAATGLMMGVLAMMPSRASLGWLVFAVILGGAVYSIALMILYPRAKSMLIVTLARLGLTGARGT